MPERPTLTTARLVLRPLTVADAPDVQRLAGEREVASTTLNIPHPYEPGMTLVYASINTMPMLNWAIGSAYPFGVKATVPKRHGQSYSMASRSSGCTASMPHT